MSRNRTAFSDNQRAEIFQADRAICSYSGRSLWIADFGIDPAYEIDWADHIRPASLGGESVFENGVAASASENYQRGNRDAAPMMFHRGKPTKVYLSKIGKVPEHIKAHLLRFSRLQISDWFLNRALWHIWIACHREYEAACGYQRSRGKEYYTSAAAKTLGKWRRKCAREEVSSIEARGLGPRKPESDQTVLLTARKMSTQAELLQLVEQLVEGYVASAALLDDLCDCQSRRDVNELRKALDNVNSVPSRIQERIRAGLLMKEKGLPATRRSK